MRRKDSHKGDNGRVLVVGGSERYVGAPALAGLAALRSGADIVTIAAPERVAWAINTMSPDLITVKLRGHALSPAHAKDIRTLAQSHDVILIGNGLGRTAAAGRLVRAVTRLGLRCVIDADALAAVRLQQLRHCLLTPHRQEFEELCTHSGIGTHLAGLKKHVNTNVLLLKGLTDAIISHEKTAYNRTGNAGMTVAGTGDVLAGLCAGLAGQGYTLFQAASRAASALGTAADRLLKARGYGYLASDLVEAL